jgi:hypothetical protein
MGSDPVLQKGILVTLQVYSQLGIVGTLTFIRIHIATAAEGMHFLISGRIPLYSC